MATAQVNGNPVTATSTRNDGGVMKANGGDFPGAPLHTNPTPDPYLGVFASTVVEGVNALPSISGGVFAHNHQLPLCFLVTDELAGLPSDALNSPADVPEYVRNPAPWTVLRTRRLTTAIREGKFDIYTGTFASGYPVTAVDEWWDIDSGAVPYVPDTAATPTQEVPGHLDYMYGSLLPSGDTYKPRSIW